MGRPAVPPEEKAARAAQLTALREHLKQTAAPGGPWTQEAVADRAGILRPNYNSMENGRLGFSGKGARKVARVFGLDMDDFEAYLDGRLVLADVLGRRSPFAGPFVAELDRLGALKRLLKANPDRWYVTTLVRGIGMEPHLPRGADGEVDWTAALDAIQSGAEEELYEEGVAAVALHKASVPPRPPIQGFTTETPKDGVRRRAKTSRPTDSK